MKHIQIEQTTNKHEAATKAHLLSILEGLYAFDAEVHQKIAAIQTTLTVLQESPMPTNGISAAHTPAPKHVLPPPSESPAPGEGEEVWLEKPQAAERLGVSSYIFERYHKANLERKQEYNGKRHFWLYRFNGEAAPVADKPNRDKDKHLDLMRTLRAAPPEAIFTTITGKPRGIKRDWIFQQIQKLPGYKKRFTVSDVIATLEASGIPASYAAHGLYAHMASMSAAGLLVKTGKAEYRGA